MKKLHSPENEVQLAMIRSMLEAEGIPYFVHNHHFGSLSVGPHIGLVNVKTIMVDEQDEEKARELLFQYLHEEVQETDGPPDQLPSPGDKWRMIAEFLLFGWFMPGRRSRKSNKENNDTP